MEALSTWFLSLENQLAAIQSSKRMAQSDLDFLNSTLSNSSSSNNSTGQQVDLSAIRASIDALERSSRSYLDSGTAAMTESMDENELMDLLAKLDNVEEAADDIEGRLDGLLSTLDGMIGALERLPPSASTTTTTGTSDTTGTTAQAPSLTASTSTDDASTSIFSSAPNANANANTND